MRLSHFHSIILSATIVVASAAAPSGVVAQADASLAMAVRFSKPELVKKFLEAGADPNERVDDPPNGNVASMAFTTMNGMALYGRLDRPDPVRRAAAVDVVRLLAAYKANFDVPFRAGPRDATPLMLAAEAGALDVVKILLDAGANPNVMNAGKYTAIDFAVDRAPFWSAFPAEDRVEIVRLLLAKGARVDRAGADRVRPLERAKRLGNTAMAALLGGT
jgi:ankyrin repeat protein